MKKVTISQALALGLLSEYSSMSTQWVDRHCKKTVLINGVETPLIYDNLMDAGLPSDRQHQYSKTSPTIPTLKVGDKITITTRRWGKERDEFLSAVYYDGTSVEEYEVV